MQQINNHSIVKDDASTSELSVKKNISYSKAFSDLIPDLSQRRQQFRVPDEYVDDDIRDAFNRQMEIVEDALLTAVVSDDADGIRRQAHSLQGMGGAAGFPEISVVGVELSHAAKNNNFTRCKALATRLSEISRDTSNIPKKSIPAGDASKNQLSSGRILVVDDELPNRLFLRKLLTSQGAEVIEAENGEQALKLAKSEKPDLALVDVMMPGISGYDLCRDLKSDPATKDTTVIMVTARTTPEDVEHAFILGAFDYIRKPFHARELMARTRHALDLKRQNDELHQWQHRMTREMDAAGALQQKLLSHDPFFGETIEIRFAHQASMSVGGDVFNAIKLPDGKVCIYVADVAGHGVAPAMIATLLKALVEDVVREYSNLGPAAMCCDIHRRFRQYVTNPESYASMFLAVIAPDGHCTSYNCGHPAPLLFDAQGAEMPTLDDLGGMPIGMPDLTDKQPYGKDDEVHTTLKPDNVMCVFTDGLSEAPLQESSDFCGTTTLGNFLSEILRDKSTIKPAHTLMEQLTKAGYDLRHDDCTLLVIRAYGSDAANLQWRITPTHENVSGLAEKTYRLLREHGWADECAGAVQLLVMEHGANVVKYGQLQPGESMELQLRLSEQYAQLICRDPGRAWDFSKCLSRTEGMPEDAESGRGLRIIKAIVAHADFLRSEGNNISCYYINRSFRADEHRIEEVDS